VSTVLIWLLGVSPVYIIAAAGIGGYLWGRYLKRKQDEKR
jgi:chromate transporter